MLTRNPQLALALTTLLAAGCVAPAAPIGAAVGPASVQARGVDAAAQPFGLGSKLSGIPKMAAAAPTRRAATSFW